MLETHSLVLLTKPSRPETKENQPERSCFELRNKTRSQVRASSWLRKGCAEESGREEGSSPVWMLVNAPDSGAWTQERWEHASCFGDEQEVSLPDPDRMREGPCNENLLLTQKTSPQRSKRKDTSLLSELSWAL